MRPIVDIQWSKCVGLQLPSSVRGALLRLRRCLSQPQLDEVVGVEGTPQTTAQKVRGSNPLGRTSNSPVAEAAGDFSFPERFATASVGFRASFPI